jgi:hypothetical protein
MKILVGDFSAKADREDILKPTIGNESLYGYGTIVVNCATYKKSHIQKYDVPTLQIHKYLDVSRWESP